MDIPEDPVHRGRAAVITRMVVAVVVGALLVLAAGLTTPGVASAKPGPFYYIVSVHSGLPIYPKDSSKSLGAPIVQTGFTNEGAKHWRVWGTSTSRFFQNRYSHYCMRVASYGDYQPVVQSTAYGDCDNALLQDKYWDVSNYDDMWAGRPITIKNHVSRRCLDDAGHTSPDSPIIQLGCNGSVYQQFRLVYVPGT